MARKRGLHFKMAVIYSDVSKDLFLERAEDGLVRGSISLDDGGPLKTEDVEVCSVMVGAMGVEPIVDALDAGADVVLCGRAVDAAVIAAYPIWRGFDRGLAYHMGDIMECAELVAEEIAPP